jgi:hypothetical protein
MAKWPGPNELLVDVPEWDELALHKTGWMEGATAAHRPLEQMETASRGTGRRHSSGARAWGNPRARLGAQRFSPRGQPAQRGTGTDWHDAGRARRASDQQGANVRLMRLTSAKNEDQLLLCVCVHIELCLNPPPKQNKSRQQQTGGESRRTEPTGKS